jgi:hypothetical protein
MLDFYLQPQKKKKKKAPHLTTLIPILGVRGYSSGFFLGQVFLGIEHPVVAP